MAPKTPTFRLVNVPSNITVDQLLAPNILSPGGLINPRGATASAGISKPAVRTSSASSTRRIHVTGTARLYSTFQTVEGAESYLKQKFIAAGWKLYNFDFTQTGYTFSISFDIDISADVSNAYTNQQQLDFVSSVFNNYIINLGVTQSKGITDLRLQISGNDAPGASRISDVPTNSIGYSSGGTTGSPPDSDSYQALLDYLKGKGKPDEESWLESLGKAFGLDGLAKSLGLVAGTATITAVAVGGIFLIVMLKR